MPATLKSRLPDIAAGLRRRVIVATEQGAELVAQKAKARVPIESGSLRNAIHVERDGADVYVVAGDREAFYGHMVEHGTRHSAPHPFLIPALEESRDAILDLIEANLKRL
jgi:HK97 gp10 family phage protein